MSVTWQPGEQRVGGDDEVVHRNASTAAQLDGVRLMVSIYPRDWRSVPLTSRDRGEFSAYAASIAKEFPAIRDFIVGNEPNLNLFWMPQFGMGGIDLAARSYELLLARTYDALKLVSDDVNVIGGALASHGQDKPDSDRPTHPDVVHQRPRLRVPRHAARASDHGHVRDPSVLDPVTAAAELRPPADDDDRRRRLSEARRAAHAAFRGTAQRGETLPIVYDEFGYQSKIPAASFVYNHLGARPPRTRSPRSCRRTTTRRRSRSPPVSRRSRGC